MQKEDVKEIVVSKFTFWKILGAIQLSLITLLISEVAVYFFVKEKDFIAMLWLMLLFSLFFGCCWGVQGGPIFFRKRIIRKLSLKVTDDQVVAYINKETERLHEKKIDNENYFSRIIEEAVAEKEKHDARIDKDIDNLIKLLQ